MPPRHHSADLRGRRQDLGISIRDMAAGLGFGMGRMLTMEDGTATEEDRTFSAREPLSQTATVERPKTFITVSVSGKVPAPRLGASSISTERAEAGSDLSRFRTRRAARTSAIETGAALIGGR
jgi:hypothetical protein